MAMPQEFENLLKFMKEGYKNSCVSEGESYNTIRFGTCRSGACYQYEFNLSLNEELYHVEVYGSDRGGSAYSPARFGVDLTVKKVQNSIIADYSCNIELDNEIVFRNLARLFRANYPNRDSGIPQAGII